MTVLWINLLVSLLLLVITSLNHETAGAVSSSSSADDHVLINSSCTSTTLYPADLCYSTFNFSADDDVAVITKRDVILRAINKTKDTIKANLHTIKNSLTATPNLSKLSKTALRDCLEMGSATLQGLNTVIHDLREYPTKKSLRQYADDLKTLMSTTITNKETCLDSLSTYDSAPISKRLRKSIIKDLDRGGKMCSNVLAMIKNMTDTDITINNANNNINPHDVGGHDRKLKEENKQQQVSSSSIRWPEWLSTRDRKLLGFWGVPTPNVIVAANGKGNYTTVAAALAAAPLKSSRRYVIKITAGVYKEYLEIPRNKPNIMLVGDGRGNTIITGNKHVAGGDTTTTRSATVAATGARFLARDITFQNTAGPSGGQAVALRVASDLSAFYKCGMDGYQDTLYVHSNRQFYVKCFISGTVDFIFGNAAVVFQFCDIMARKPNPGQRNMVTAQGRTDKNQDTGIVIQKCNIGATQELKAVQAKFPTYLGRPWKNLSRTVVMRSWIGDVIQKEGWYPWDGDFALDTVYYREYRNRGPGADTSKRVTWKGWGVMKDNGEARPFTVARFIDGWTWLLSTGFPFWPGL